MKQQPWKTYLFWIAVTQGMGALAGWLTRGSGEFYRAVLRQPPLSPPGWVFPVVWTVLYALMGAGIARLRLAAGPDRGDTRLYLVQLAFNFLWPLFFFRARLLGFSLVWLMALWTLVLGMVLTFRQKDVWAARLELPYLIWVSFAVYLNLGVWLLNR